MKSFKIFFIIIIVLLNVVGLSKKTFAETDEISGDTDVGVGEMIDLLPEVYFKAINPGYKVDDKNNVGEMIEIGFRKENPDDLVSLAGLTISYTNSSGNSSMLVEFPEHSFATGENILLRLAGAEDAELANLVYTKTLAFQGGLVLLRDGEVIDEVCWTGKNNCEKAFKSSSPTVLIRNLGTGGFEHVDNYEPVYDLKAYRVDEPMNEDVGGMGEMEAQCKGLMFTEIFSYYEELKTEQFVEIYNFSSEQVLVKDCFIKYKNKLYAIDGIVKPEEYMVRYATDFSLTKNPNNYNTLELVDINGLVVDKVDYPNGQKKGTSYAFIGYDASGERIWRTTYAVTPGAPNHYQEFKTCEEGKVINEVTGNCVKVTNITEKTCGEGEYLNPLTGRCRKIEVATVKTCKEGYELNPDTNRCIKTKKNDGTNYSLKTEDYEEETSFVALYAICGVVGAGIIYVIYEFRREIGKKITSIKRKLFKK